MNTRKKTPKAIYEQINRIVGYLTRKTWKNGTPSDEENNKLLETCSIIGLTASRYISNIYKLAGVDINYASVSESNKVWYNYQASSEEYTNGNCLHEKANNIYKKLVVLCKNNYLCKGLQTKNNKHYDGNYDYIVDYRSTIRCFSGPQVNNKEDIL